MTQATDARGGPRTLPVPHRTRMTGHGSGPDRRARPATEPGETQPSWGPACEDQQRADVSPPAARRPGPPPPPGTRRAAMVHLRPVAFRRPGGNAGSCAVRRARRSRCRSPSGQAGYGLIPGPGASPHSIPLLGPGPGFDRGYAITTDLAKPVIIATVPVPAGASAALLIDGYALPVIAQVEVTAPKLRSRHRIGRGRAPLEGARPRLVHLRLGPACLLSRMAWAGARADWCDGLPPLVGSGLDGIWLVMPEVSAGGGVPAW
jgi:hypothetical protein